MTSISVGNRRLLKLADFLDRLPRKRFDYSHWVGEDWKGAPDLSCGTTACALGWATTMPEFRRLGLRMDRHGPFMQKRNGKQLTSITLGLFALPSWIDGDLFCPTSTREDFATPKYVARKIRRFVAERKP